MSVYTQDDVRRRARKWLREGEGEHAAAIRLASWSLDRRSRLAVRARERGRLDLAQWHDDLANLERHVVRELERLAAVSGD